MSESNRIGVIVEARKLATRGTKWDSEETLKTEAAAAQQTGRNTCEKGAACCMVVTVGGFGKKLSTSGRWSDTRATINGICASEDCPDRPDHVMDVVFDMVDDSSSILSASPVFEGSEQAQSILSSVEQQ